MTIVHEYTRLKATLCVLQTGHAGLPFTFSLLTQVLQNAKCIQGIERCVRSADWHTTHKQTCVTEVGEFKLESCE